MEIVNPIIYSDKEGYPSAMHSYDMQEDFLEIKDHNGVALRIYIIDEYILRFRYAVEGLYESDFSYAIDPTFQKKKIETKLLESEKLLTLSTPAVVCKIAKRDLRISIYDHAGRIILEDEKGFHWEENKEYGGFIVQNSKVVQSNEVFYGLGDKPTDLNIRGKRFQNWGTDEYGYHYNTDPLYKSIPIYYGLHNNIGYGVFFDNSFEAYFDFGSERTNVTSFWAQGGEMNYYFIAGPELMDVCRRYTMLTGTPEMPPMWALGFQQCKWSYYPESKVKEITSTMRKLKIPCDAIYLDIDYMDGFRCFTWNEEYFPEPKRMVEELKEDGWKTMVIIDPGIKKDMTYSVFKEGLEKGYFCRRMDGPYVEGKVWPGMCYFPDFTRPEVREWWAGLYKDLIEDIGIAGVWNDMNEPALFEVPSKTFPNDVLHDYDGHLTSHRKAHNIYGMQMARATAEGVKQFKHGKRSLIITRSGYAGMQRYSSVWTGDNIATWEHLWIADVQAQRLAISGVSFCGSDIGGFIGQPTAELMIRWIQMGIFHPFCRVHSSGDHGDQEPWAFGDKCTAMYKKFIEIRYQLLPYLYTTFYQYHKIGTPMLRPIVFFDQTDKQNIDRDFEFLCGDHMLVCPVMKAEIKTKHFYLPKGEWVDYWTDKVYEGSTEYNFDIEITTIPIFVKRGAVIPNYPIQQYVGEKNIEQVTLNVYHVNGVEKSQFFEDGGEGYGYEEGDFRLAEFVVEGDVRSLKVEQNISGDHTPSFATYNIVLKALPFDITHIQVDGEEMSVVDKTEFVVKSDFRVLEIS
ncbi:MAG: TIM-barrel domain-containing protein [Bacteroidota bacterium]